MNPAKTIFALSCLLLAACAGRHSATTDEFSLPKYKPRYASGFEILEAEGRESSVIKITDPWQGAEGYEQKIFVARNGETLPPSFDGQTVEAPVRRVVCLSSSHVAMFDAIGAIERVVGVSGIGFITNSHIASHRDTVGDVGYDTNIDFELMAALRPDIVMMYGVAGENSQISSKLRELGIPYIYIGDYVENSPLGKAEWLHVAAELTERQAAASEFFDRTASKYELLAQRVRDHLGDDGRRPDVMLNTPYRDVWFMPSGESYIVRLITDAGGKTYTPSQTGTTSQPVDLEKAYLLATDADVWLNTGACNTLGELKAQNPRFAGMNVVTGARVYNCNKRRTPSGGSDFWESGVVHPDVVLRDLVTILHPDIAGEATVYYERLR